VSWQAACRCHGRWLATNIRIVVDGPTGSSSRGLGQIFNLNRSQTRQVTSGLNSEVHAMGSRDRCSSLREDRLYDPESWKRLRRLSELDVGPPLGPPTVHYSARWLNLSLIVHVATFCIGK
jgi:hypothetical protein